MTVYIPEGQAFKGRKVRVKWKGEYIRGLREKGIAMAGEPVDITSDDDDGWRTLADENGAAQDNIDISLSGINKVSVLREDWMARERTGELIVEYPTGHQLSGTFVMVNHTDANPYNESSTYEVTFQNSGAVTLDYVLS